MLPIISTVLGITFAVFPPLIAANVMTPDSRGEISLPLA